MTSSPVINDEPTVAPKGSRAETARKIGSRIVSVISYTIVFFLGLIIVVNVVVPRVFGMNVFNIVSSSMEPTLQVGDLVVVKPTEPENIKTQDIITFQLESGKPLTATHRVVAATESGGQYFFRTKGDNNDAPDAKLVRQEQVRGVMKYKIPLIGDIAGQVDNDTRQNIIKVFGVLVLIEGLLVLFGVRGKKKREEPELEQSQPEADELDKDQLK